MHKEQKRVKPVDVGIVGGAGHVGLPLALSFAHAGLRVLIQDRSAEALRLIGDGVMPFLDAGAPELLKEALANDRLVLSQDPKSLAGVPIYVVTIGTPIDEFHNPAVADIKSCMDTLFEHAKGGETLILRSTVYPGTTQWLHTYCQSHGKDLKIAFCPERVVQGKAIEELPRLPQIISGTSPEAIASARLLFQRVCREIIELTPGEAELAKLFSNAYRYIQFAAANQFYMISYLAGIDYYRVLRAMKKGYDRLADLPGAGFTAGPCLFKDTMQLTGFMGNRFGLGYAAMHVNEGLPRFVIDTIDKVTPLKDKCVGLLGMAFKADSDDLRSSLSYKLKKQLMFRAKKVLTTDPFVSTDPDIRPLDEVIDNSDILILGTPHSAYRDLDTRGKRTIDVWDFWGRGGLI
jgi:UDP-N-acetyl-D-mannosaminuronic acid dehydrogenase